MKVVREEKLSLNELNHYGIPGMKWGVQKAKSFNKRITDSYEKKAQKIFSKAEDVDPTAKKSVWQRIKDDRSIRSASNISRDRRTDYRGLFSKRANAAGERWNNMTAGERLRQLRIGKDAAIHMLSILSGSFLIPGAGAIIGDSVARQAREEQYATRIDYGKKFVNEFINGTRKH